MEQLIAGSVIALAGSAMIIFRGRLEWIAYFLMPGRTNEDSLEYWQIMWGVAAVIIGGLVALTGA